MGVDIARQLGSAAVPGRGAAWAAPAAPERPPVRVPDRWRPALRRIGLVATLVAAVAGALVWTRAVPGASAAPPADLGRLLRFLALVKALVPIGALWALQRRVRRPVAAGRLATYAAGLGSAGAGAALIAQLGHVGLGAALFHAGWITMVAAAWRDDVWLDRGPTPAGREFDPSFRIPRSTILGLTLAIVIATPAYAQDATMTPVATPDQSNAIALGTGSLLGATAPESWHRQYGSLFARNVTVATLTPYLPDPATASGAAVVVAPGGGFRTLSMENEGSNVAKALAARGVAAFVLKYRLVQTPADMPGFERSMARMFSGTAARPPAPSTPEAMAAGIAPQVADARAAFALIRRRAAEWHVNPTRIGMVGFSAGAMLTLTTAVAGQDARPAFVGDIYGPVSAMAVPADAPPLFVAVAADDPFFGGGEVGIVRSWIAAKRPVELHLFEQGGHGFGMYPKATTSTGWFDEFARWLGMHGMLTPPR